MRVGAGLFVPAFPLCFTAKHCVHFTDEETGADGHIAGPGDLKLRSTSKTFLLSTHLC